MPTGWHEIPFNIGLDIFDNEYDEITILSKLSGKSYDEIRNCTDIDTIYYFANAFNFLSELPTQIHDFPTTIKIGDERVIMPFIPDKFDLGEASFAQVEDMKAIIKKMSSEFLNGLERDLTNLELIKITPYLVSIFLYKITHGEYDANKALRFRSHLEANMSFKDIVCIGYFFLQRLSGLMNGSNQSFRLRLTPKKRFLREFRKLMKRSGYLLRLIWYQYIRM